MCQTPNLYPKSLFGLINRKHNHLKDAFGGLQVYLRVRTAKQASYPKKTVPRQNVFILNSWPSYSITVGAYEEYELGKTTILWVIIAI